MLTRKDVVRVMKDLKWNKDDFIIISGAALVMAGLLKETNDIDASITKELYDSLDWPEEDFNGFKVKKHGDLDVSSVGYKELCKDHETKEFNYQNPIRAIEMKKRNLDNFTNEMLAGVSSGSLKGSDLYKTLLKHNYKENALFTALYNYANMKH